MHRNRGVYNNLSTISNEDDLKDNLIVIGIVFLAFGCNAGFAHSLYLEFRGGFKKKKKGKAMW